MSTRSDDNRRIEKIVAVSFIDSGDNMNVEFGGQSRPGIAAFAAGNRFGKGDCLFHVLENVSGVTQLRKDDQLRSVAHRLFYALNGSSDIFRLIADLGPHLNASHVDDPVAFVVCHIHSPPDLAFASVTCYYFLRIPLTRTLVK